MVTDNLIRSNSIEFLITNVCNLRCKYCFMEKNLGKDKVDIESIKAYLSQGGNRSVYVFGGEPLVNIEAIVELIDYTETLDVKNKEEILKSLRSITTNGTLIEKHLDLIKKYNLKLQISLDGDREANDQRVDLQGNESFDQVKKGVDLCREHKIAHSIHGVLSQKNLLRYAEIIKFLYDLMREDPTKKNIEEVIKYFQGNFSMVVLEENFTDEFIDKMIIQLEELTKWILSLDITKDEKKLFFEGVVARKKVYGVCGAGMGLHTTDNQNMLYPCHRSICEPDQALGNAFNAEDLQNLGLYNSFFDLKWNGKVYSTHFELPGINLMPKKEEEKKIVGWAMWCPSTNLETSNDITYASSKYSVFISEINRFTNYLEEAYEI